MSKKIQRPINPITGKDFARWHKCKLETDKQLEVVA
jgi:hypothetical protein